MRWVEAYFPFTNPSAELEIFYRVSFQDLWHVLDLISDREGLGSPLIDVSIVNLRRDTIGISLNRRIAVG